MNLCVIAVSLTALWEFFKKNVNHDIVFKKNQSLRASKKIFILR